MAPEQLKRLRTQFDLSPEVIDKRLRAFQQLYRLSMSLPKAKRLGKVRDLEKSIEESFSETPT